jgi:hypothetical protein
VHPLDRPHVPLDPMLRGELDAAEAAFEAARKKFREAYEAHQRDNERLVYAAHAHCKCGAGLAYLNTAGIRGDWRCSAVLKDPNESGLAHDGPFPFAFYEIKSENQPSACGATTRPKEL